MQSELYYLLSLAEGYDLAKCIACVLWINNKHMQEYVSILIYLSIYFAYIPIKSG